MGAVAGDADGSVDEAGVENVHEERQKGTDILAGCAHYALQGLLAGGRAASVAHSDAPSVDSLRGVLVERAHNGRSYVLSSISRGIRGEFEPSWSAMWCCQTRRSPQRYELGAAHPLPSSTVDGQWEML